MRKRKKHNRRLKKWVKPFFTVLAIAIAGSILAIILFSHSSYQAESGTLGLQLNTTAAVIRNEKSYFSDFDFSKIDFSEQEGAQVAAGSELATVYKLGYTDDVAQSLYNIQQEIYDTQMQLLHGVNKPEVEAIQERIDALIEELRLVKEGNEGRQVSEIETDIKIAVGERSSKLKEIVQATEELSTLYNQETAMVERLSEWTKRVVAGDEGIFSCYSDGLEQVMNTEKLELLTPAQVNNAIQDDGYSTATSDNGFMYRIVKDTGFCLGVIIENDSIPRLYENEEYSVQIASFDAPVTAKCERTALGDEYYLAILTVDAPLGELLTTRTVRVTVSAAYNGIKINLNAVTSQGGKLFVTDDATKEKIEVDVLAKNKNYVIIRETDGQGKLQVGGVYTS